MSRRPTPLSTRARNVLVRAVFHHRDANPTTPFEEAWGHAVRPKHALWTLREKAIESSCSLRHLILRTRGGGMVTLRELLTWMGVADRHECVCRVCGRRL